MTGVLSEAVAVNGVLVVFHVVNNSFVDIGADPVGVDDVAAGEAFVVC